MYTLFVSSLGGATLEVLKCYIKDQEKPSFYDGVLTQIFDKIEINISVVTRC